MRLFLWAMQGARVPVRTVPEDFNLALSGPLSDTKNASIFAKMPAMNRSRALALLAASKPLLISRYGVRRLALFGSTARDAAGSNSDIDILVDFDGPATSERYFGVQFHLEDVFGCPVDLVTEKAVRPELRPAIEKEAVHV
jgi:predicted nucleotidyltransferase